MLVQWHACLDIRSGNGLERILTWRPCPSALRGKAPVGKAFSKALAIALSTQRWKYSPTKCAGQPMAVPPASKGTRSRHGTRVRPAYRREWSAIICSDVALTPGRPTCCLARCRSISSGSPSASLEVLRGYRLVPPRPARVPASRGLGAPVGGCARRRWRWSRDPGRTSRPPQRQGRPDGTAHNEARDRDSSGASHRVSGSSDL